MIVCQVVFDSCLLVFGHGKIVAESTTRVDDFLASRLGLVDCGVGWDLSSTNGGNVRASSREAWIENISVGRLCAYPSTRVRLRLSMDIERDSLTVRV